MLATATGLILVAAGLREVFHQILHPGGAGRLTSALFRAVWRVAGRLGEGAMSLAGPLGVAASIATWALLVLVGFALIYWPHVPEGFQYASGIEPGRQGALLDALYVSGVTLATLGLGDIVGEPAGLRFAAVFEALIGFTLLTAGITWVLSIYPALMRRRSLASRIDVMLEGEGEQARLRAGDPPSTLATLLHDLADQIGSARVDFVQYPASYFFRAPSRDLALGPALVSLGHALSHSDDVSGEAATAAQTVQRAISALEGTLATGPFGLGEGATVARYSADHGG